MVVVVSRLSKRLTEAKGDRTNDEIVERARLAGFSIDRSAVSRYLRGEHGPAPRPATLEALASGFGLDVLELRELVGLPAGEPEPYQPPPISASLTRKQRAALDQLIKAMVKGDDDDDAGDAEAQKKRPVKSLGEEFAQLDGVPELTRPEEVTLAARDQPGYAKIKQARDAAKRVGEETQDHGGIEPA